MAETTTTRSWPAARSRAIRRATRLMRSASATDEPPNFWTTRGAGIAAFYRPGRHAPAERGGGLRWRPVRIRPGGGPPMCFDLDSRPPIAPIAGGALDSERLVLHAADANALSAFLARATDPSGAGVVILPDVRGLHPYYEELALRFAEHGIDAVAIDWFGRTAGTAVRGDDFDHMPHVAETTWAGIASRHRGRGRGGARARTGPRTGQRARDLHGRLLHGRPDVVPGRDAGAGPCGRHRLLRHPRGAVAQRRPRAARRGRLHHVAGPRPVRRRGRRHRGGRDRRLRRGAVDAGVDHRLVTYEGAPHSFFDRKAAEFADASEGAWAETLAFVRRLTPAAGA